VNRLYQWLSQRASSFRSETADRGTSRTVRTEVTVQQQGMTLLVGDAADAGFHTCPLCGTELVPVHAAQIRDRLLKGSISREAGRVDRAPPGSWV